MPWRTFVCHDVTEMYVRGLDAGRVVLLFGELETHDELACIMYHAARVHGGQFRRAHCLTIPIEPGTSEPILGPPAPADGSASTAVPPALVQEKPNDAPARIAPRRIVLPPRRLTAEDLARAVRVLVWLMGIGAAVWLAGWSLRTHGRLPSYVRENHLERAQRIWVIVNLALGAGCGIVFMATVVLWNRRAGLAVGLRRAERIAHRLAPLVLAPLVPALWRWQIWSERELSHLGSVTLFALSSLGLWRLSLAAGPIAPTRVARLAARILGWFVRAARWPRLPPLLLALAIFGYAAYFSYYTINIHHNLQTHSYDLAIENNLLWNLVHGGELFRTTPHEKGPMGSHMGFHHTYLSYVLAIFYVFWPKPEMLLVLQAVFIAAAGWPLYLLARRRVPDWTALAVALVYLLYPPVHGANLYDFHYPPFMPFFMWFMLYFTERNRTVVALIFALLSISIREDAAACVALWGLYLISSRTNARFGAAILVLGALHFVVSKMILMPWVLGGHHAYVHQYRDLIPEGMAGFGGVLVTVLGNPAYTLHTLLREPIKLVYVLQIAVPLVFLPWRRPIGILFSVPGLFFTLLATYYDPMVQISFQYTFFWTTFVFVGLVLNLDWVAQPRHFGDTRGVERRRAWMLAILGSTVLCSYQYGGILQREYVRGGFGHKPFGPVPEQREQRAHLYSLIALLPPDAKVASTEQIVPHVSSREFAYTLRVGVFDAEYLLFPVPLFGPEAEHVRKALASGDYGVMRSAGPFVMARRGHSTQRNQEILLKL